MVDLEEDITKEAKQNIQAQNNQENENNRCKVGRQDNYIHHIQLLDCTISRNHAVIYKPDQKVNRYLIKDKGSKFGTFIQILESYDIVQNQNIEMKDTNLQFSNFVLENQNTKLIFNLKYGFRDTYFDEPNTNKTIKVEMEEGKPYILGRQKKIISNNQNSNNNSNTQRIEIESQGNVVSAEHATLIFSFDKNTEKPQLQIKTMDSENKQIWRRLNNPKGLNDPKEAEGEWVELKLQMRLRFGQTDHFVIELALDDF